MVIPCAYSHSISRLNGDDVAQWMTKNEVVPREELEEARAETKQVRLKTECENEALRMEVAKLRKLVTLPFDPMPTILGVSAMASEIRELKVGLEEADSAYTERVSILNAKNAELADELKKACAKVSAAANEEANRVIGVVCGQGYWTADELLRALGYSSE